MVTTRSRRQLPCSDRDTLSFIEKREVMFTGSTRAISSPTPYVVYAIAERGFQTSHKFT